MCRKHTDRTQVGWMRKIFSRMHMICIMPKLKNDLTSCVGGYYVQKDQTKWETFSDQSVEVSSKPLRINEVGWYFVSSTPCTPITPASRHYGSEDTPIKEVRGLICPIGRKTANRQGKVVVQEPILVLMTKELFVLGATSVRNSTMFERYVTSKRRGQK